jgi:hypothetical protein
MVPCDCGAPPAAATGPAARRSFDFDLALLFLDSDAPPQAQPIRLAASALPPVPRPGGGPAFEVLGWGATGGNDRSGGGLSTRLMSGAVQQLPPVSCARTFQPYGVVGVSPQQLCMTGATVYEEGRVVLVPAACRVLAVSVAWLLAAARPRVDACPPHALVQEPPAVRPPPPPPRSL